MCLRVSCNISYPLKNITHYIADITYYDMWSENGRDDEHTLPMVVSVGLVLNILSHLCRWPIRYDYTPCVGFTTGLLDIHHWCQCVASFPGRLGTRLRYHLPWGYMCTLLDIHRVKAPCGYMCYYCTIHRVASPCACVNLGQEESNCACTTADI